MFGGDRPLIFCECPNGVLPIVPLDFFRGSLARPGRATAHRCATVAKGFPKTVRVSCCQKNPWIYKRTEHFSAKLPGNTPDSGLSSINRIPIRPLFFSTYGKGARIKSSVSDMSREDFQAEPDALLDWCKRPERNTFFTITRVGRFPAASGTAEVVSSKAVGRHQCGKNHGNGDALPWDRL